MQAATGKSARRRCCINLSFHPEPAPISPERSFAPCPRSGICLEVFSPFPALLLLPPAASSAPALQSGWVFQAWLVDLREKRDAANGQGGVCKLLLCKYSAESTHDARDPGSALLLPAREVPWPELSQGLHSSKMSPEVEEQSLPAQSHCSWECWGSLPPSLSIFFLHHGCGVSDGAADSIPTL